MTRTSYIPANIILDIQCCLTKESEKSLKCALNLNNVVISTKLSYQSRLRIKAHILHSEAVKQQQNINTSKRLHKQAIKIFLNCNLDVNQPQARSEEKLVNNLKEKLWATRG